jgi:predicted outer membrane repeat protein
MATAMMLALGVFGVSAASAATLTVCESGPPTCGYSSIQKAVNAASSGDEISIADGTYNLIRGELSIEKSLTLQGAGPERTILNGGVVAVGTHSSHPVVTIFEVTIANGTGVRNGAGSTLTLDNSVLKNNAAFEYGGILNEGTLTLSNSMVSGNTATEGGGGIRNDRGGTLMLGNSTLSGNSATNEGGGIANEEGGTVTLSNSTVTANSATNGGGIYNESGTVTLHNAKVTSNKAAHKGGGIYNEATVAGNNDTITLNTAPEGPGIFNESPGVVNLKHSEIQP